MTLAGVDARLAQEGKRLNLDGTVKDSTWGDWKVGGWVDSDKGTSQLVLTGDKVILEQKRLRGLPFVTPSLWEEIEANGPARVVLGVNMGGGLPLHYHVEIDPLGADLRVVAASIDAHDVTGKIVIDDGQVTVRNGVGKSAGGDIRAEGDLDFRKEPYVLNIRARVEGVAFQQFSKGWGVQQLKNLSGRLEGKANLELKIADKLTINGEGSGLIRDAKLAT
jgi:hypothetical protein